MTECNRKKQLLGKSIRKIRVRRNMTQRELANAIEGIGESALRSYELGERSPKQNALERIAKALDWHGYWLGKRDNPTDLVIKWIAPVIVNGGNGELLGRVHVGDGD